ncbi:alpha-amylase family protein [Actinoplanes sp. N902-109]|uniref:alpha-amylase family protein n=1 Tax=Actinoplanes sp. (strain N902-109) TaxID=649831 RepID=UPI00032941BF|nr:alpha-amylase family protein [Actinoplanes sp. N902-109]AGL14207.1 cyclomaltodextrinase [Actinoplanes sp. N902-109]
MTEAEWVRHAIWWQIYPLGFTGAFPARPSHPAGGLGRLHNWLDYAIELGASGLLLGPIFAAETHGYDTVDHYRIDPRLGDGDDFDRLVAAAHDRGLRVLLDGVFNHVGRGHPALGHDSWIRRTPDGRAATFEGHDSLVVLNHAEPAVADYVTGVMTHWLGRGADGWRLDAAYAVPPRFWAQVLPRVRAEFPQAYVFGEVIHGDYADFVQRSTVDSVTQYELWKAIWSSLNDGNFYELSWALERHNGFLDTFVPQTFIGNHDVTRIASRLTNEQHLPLALAVLLTTAGTPSIWSGDEQGFRGVKEDKAHGDDAVRPEFPDDPGRLAPYGKTLLRLHEDLIGERRRHPWLHRARTRTLHLSNEQFVYEVSDGDQKLIVALNAADKPAQAPGHGELPPTSWQISS